MASAARDHRPATLLRPATTADVPALARLIRVSAAHLSRGFYTPDQIDAAITHVFGVDTDLIADGTFFLVERDGALAGCGGWSRRATLFGGDACPGRSDRPIVPGEAPARIRAFFVDPAHSRQGVATALLDRCEREARAAGFDALTLVATLSGVPFHRAAGFADEQPVDHIAGGTAVPFIQMTKPLLAIRYTGRGQEN